MLADTHSSRKGRRFLKRMLYSQMALRDAFLILIGKQSPHLPFTVVADPSSIYINFAIKKDMEAAFIEYINLGEKMVPVPMCTLEDDTAELLLTLNIYVVRGLVNGPRAEWSTYISDSRGIPRYMVLEARAAAGSMDPVNLFTRPDRVEHEMTNAHIVSTVASEGGCLFNSSIRIDEAHPPVQPAAQWIEANDYIYWRNGICDRTSYDASVFNGKVCSVPPTDFTFSDHTPWADFIEPRPKNVLRYNGALEFVVSPWFNI